MPMRGAADVRHWRLLAEEYRAMADNALSARARHSLEGLARTYETLADRAQAAGGAPTSSEYLSRAVECERYGDHADTPQARLAMAELAKRWRDMAREARDEAAK
jgi:hypothetical protein